jgi:hypothetical protein
MAVRSIQTDRTELVLLVKGKKKYEVMNVTYDQITRIQIRAATRIGFFKKVPSEEIVIVTRKKSEPLVYKKHKEKKYFEEYKATLEEFAKNNKVTFIKNQS